MMRTLILSALLCALAFPSIAAEAPRKSPANPVVPAPPPLPENYSPTPRVPDTEELEPEITIQTRGTEIHEEYRYNGQLYMVKVTPARGKPYYLIFDERGTSRRSDLEPDVTIPTWVIKRF